MNFRNYFLKHQAQTSPQPLALHIERAEACTLFGIDGKEYLDLISGISVSNLGHGYPDVVNAVKSQVDDYMHLMVYGELVQTPPALLAKRLCDFLPENLNSVYLLNSGAEAIEAAIKLTKRVSGKSKIFSFHHSYHGSTNGALSLMGDENWKRAFRPLLPDTHLLRYGVIEDLNQIDERTAAIFIEPVQAEAGVKRASQDYWKALKKRCREKNVLIVLDEIQTGLGRCGTLFAFEQLDLVPDLLVLAKAFGGGMPISALISDKKIMDSFSHDPVLGHITTFGGHPVCAAAALANLEVITENQFYHRALEIENYFKLNLKHSAIKEFRSFGALMAIEFESEELNMKIINECIQNGVFVDWFLFNTKAMRLAPPLIIHPDEMKKAVEIILKSINTVLKN